MKIQIETLRSAINRTLDHVLEAHGSELEIDVDYYKQLSLSDRKDLYSEPTEFEIGQLSDDWQMISEIAKKEKDPVGYSLVWVSAILQAVGEKYIS